MDGHTATVIDFTSSRQIRDPYLYHVPRPIGVHVAALMRRAGCARAMTYEVAPAVAIAPVFAPRRDSAPRAPPVPRAR
jgi:hypothetical protein